MLFYPSVPRKRRYLASHVFFNYLVYLSLLVFTRFTLVSVKEIDLKYSSH